MEDNVKILYLIQIKYGPYAYSFYGGRTDLGKPKWVSSPQDTVYLESLADVRSIIMRLMREDPNVNISGITVRVHKIQEIQELRVRPIQTVEIA